MTGILIERRNRDTEAHPGSTPCEDEGRDQVGATGAKERRRLRQTPEGEAHGAGTPARPSEDAGPADTLISDLCLQNRHHTSLPFKPPSCWPSVADLGNGRTRWAPGEPQAHVDRAHQPSRFLRQSQSPAWRSMRWLVFLLFGRWGGPGGGDMAPEISGCSPAAQQGEAPSSPVTPHPCTSQKARGLERICSELTSRARRGFKRVRQGSVSKVPKATGSTHSLGFE